MPAGVPIKTKKYHIATTMSPHQHCEVHSCDRALCSPACQIRHARRRSSKQRRRAQKRANLRHLHRVAHPAHSSTSTRHALVQIARSLKPGFGLFVVRHDDAPAFRAGIALPHPFDSVHPRSLPCAGVLQCCLPCFDVLCICWWHCFAQALHAAWGAAGPCFIEAKTCAYMCCIVVWHPGRPIRSRPGDSFPSLSPPSAPTLRMILEELDAKTCCGDA